MGSGRPLFPETDVRFMEVTQMEIEMSQQEVKHRIRVGRDFMKMPDDEELFISDQQKRLKQPPLAKAPVGSERISLAADFSGLNLDVNLADLMGRRESHRVYTDRPCSLTELSFLLWAQQGVKAIRGNQYATLRTVPCGGARHEFECYLAVRRVEGIAGGLYHYLPMTHQLECLKRAEDGELREMIGKSLCSQRWAEDAGVIFYYSMAAYRAEWRYGVYAHRVALIDSGHITQNLYLAATALGLGACAVAAVDTQYCNQLFGLDGEEEFIFYSGVAGSIREEDRQKELDFYAFLKNNGGGEEQK